MEAVLLNCASMIIYIFRPSLSVKHGIECVYSLKAERAHILLNYLILGTILGRRVYFAYSVGINAIAIDRHMHCVWTNVQKEDIWILFKFWVTTKTCCSRLDGPFVSHLAFIMLTMPCSIR